jgi:predicted nuclease of predicted toxin-antitoxin system
MSKVKLYLNENLSWRIAKSLRGYGYDVVSSHENEMNSESDECQLDYAISLEKAVVTNNFSDFAILVLSKNIMQLVSP